MDFSCPNPSIRIPMSNQSGFLVDISASPSVIPNGYPDWVSTAIPPTQLSSSSARIQYF
ncbi:hypothetical protein BC828DRAFT_383044, partial [Blastocladiella britannica]